MQPESFATLPPALQDLYTQMQDDLYDGLIAQVVEATRLALAHWQQTPAQVLQHGLVAGMDRVGADFRDGVLFVPEVFMAARAMKAAMEVLRPLLTGNRNLEPLGTAVIGTVKGDIHDIGQNLVGMMLEGAGFMVVNLGNNVDADQFVEAIRTHQADILGMSALLTTTMPYMETVLSRLQEAGLRERVTVLVGGASLTAAFAEEIGADRYCPDAAAAVEAAMTLLQIARHQPMASASGS
jgi:5-methyltetrahydrofolate--homocysteine methyltransferase